MSGMKGSGWGDEKKGGYCATCGKKLSLFTGKVRVGDNYYCPSCAKKIPKYCAVCGKQTKGFNALSKDGFWFCGSSCLMKYNERRKGEKEIRVAAISDINQKEADRELWRREVREGEITAKLIGAESPVILKRGEELRVVLPDISLVEPRSVSEGRAFYGGPTIRLAKGVSLRTGVAKGRGESHEELRNVDQGVLTLTSKRLVFSGGKRTLTIELARIVSMEPFRDGIAIRREGKEKTQYFSGINPEMISIKATVDDREYEEPFTGELLQYFIEGAIKQQVQGARITSPKSPPAATESIPDQIKKLSELKDAGILTTEEFEAKKSELLSRM